MIFGGIPPLAPQPPLQTPFREWGYPKMKINIIFGFLTIEKLRIDITHDFWWYTPSNPTTPPSKAPLGAPKRQNSGI